MNPNLIETLPRSSFRRPLNIINWDYVFDVLTCKIALELYASGIAIGLFAVFVAWQVGMIAV